MYIVEKYPKRKDFYKFFGESLFYACNCTQNYYSWPVKYYIKDTLLHFSNRSGKIRNLGHIPCEILSNEVQNNVDCRVAQGRALGVLLHK